MTYTVWYKTPNQWFWRKINKVVGEGIEHQFYDEQGRLVHRPPFRFIVCEDDTQYQIPVDSLLKFCPRRVKVIEKELKRESGGIAQRMDK